MADYDKDRELIEKLKKSEPGGDDWKQSVSALKRRIKGMLAEDQAAAAERLAEVKDSPGVAGTIEELAGKKGLALAALYPLEKALKELGKGVKEEHLRAMEEWMGLCEGGQGECDTNDFFFLPDNVQGAVLDHLALWLRADLLAELKKAAPDKEKAKRVAKSIHKAKSAGAQVAEQAGGRVAAPVAAAEREEQFDEAYLSPPDPSGTFFVYMYRTVFGKAHLFVALANDLEGVIRFDGYRVSRARFQKMLEQTKNNPHAIVVRADAGYVRRLIRAAEETGRRRNRPQNENYLSNRRALGIVDEPEAGHPLWDHIDQEELKGERGLVARSEELLEHRVFVDWRLQPAEEGRAITAIQEIRKSPIELTDAQKAERENEVYEREAGRLIEGAGREVWRDRLLSCAYVLHLMDEKEQARMTAAAALALERGEVPPFFTALVKRSLAQSMEPPEEGPRGPLMDRGGIVVP